LNPRPISDDLPILYKDYYTHGSARLRNGKPGLPAKLKELYLRSGLESRWGYDLQGSGSALRCAGRFLPLLPFLRDRIGSQVMWLKKQADNELLDVGCGEGTFLAVMRDLGWKVTGVEPDAEAARRARLNHGLDILDVPFGRTDLPDGRFDVITAGSVLEHVPDGLALLKEAKRLLKPGGRIVVLTPNPESLGHGIFGRRWFALDPPRHFFLYPPRTLRRMAGEAGLQVEELRTTAVEARVNWQESRRLRRGKRTRTSGKRGTAGRSIWGSYAFYFIESILCLFAPIGETTLLVAKNPSRTGQR